MAINARIGAMKAVMVQCAECRMMADGGRGGPRQREW